MKLKHLHNLMAGCRLRAEEWRGAGGALDSRVALAQAIEEAGWMAIAGCEQRSDAALAELSTAEEWLATA
ncbi:unnamed protein product [Linum trigynum]|uniref:Uncharacterized protein n=1 Tax=Linum trigynum TaxID=586398 RepID=A0AAV2FTD5_9ROSI